MMKLRRSRIRRPAQGVRHNRDDDDDDDDDPTVRRTEHPPLQSVATPSIRHVKTLEHVRRGGGTSFAEHATESSIHHQHHLRAQPPPPPPPRRSWNDILVGGATTDDPETTPTQRDLIDDPDSKGTDGTFHVSLKSNHTDGSNDDDDDDEDDDVPPPIEPTTDAKGRTDNHTAASAAGESPSDVVPLDDDMEDAGDVPSFPTDHVVDKNGTDERPPGTDADWSNHTQNARTYAPYQPTLPPSRNHPSLTPSSSSSTTILSIPVLVLSVLGLALLVGYCYVRCRSFFRKQNDASRGEYRQVASRYMDSAFDDVVYEEEFDEDDDDDAENDWAGKKTIELKSIGRESNGGLTLEEMNG